MRSRKIGRQPEETLLFSSERAMVDRRRSEDTPTTTDTPREVRYRYTTEDWVLTKDQCSLDV